MMNWKCAACGSENSDESERCICGFTRQADNVVAGDVARKTLKYWIGIILSICGLIYCFLGFAMVASFSVAAPERKAHWEFMAWLYLVGMAASFLLAIVFALSIFRDRRKIENLNSPQEPTSQFEETEIKGHYEGEFVEVFQTTDQSDILTVKLAFDEEQIPNNFSGDFLLGYREGRLARFFVPSEFQERAVEVLRQLTLNTDAQQWTRSQ